jgi:type IV secretion system protein VirD4
MEERPRPHDAEAKAGAEVKDAAAVTEDDDPTESERRQQPELNRVAPVEQAAPVANEFEIDSSDEAEDEAVRSLRMSRMMQVTARQISLDPADGMDM